MYNTKMSTTVNRLTIDYQTLFPIVSTQTGSRISSPYKSMLQKSDLNLIRKYFRTPSEVGAAACRRCPAAFCSRHHHALYLCQMDVQLFGHE